MGVAFGVLYVHTAGDGRIEDEAELLVDARAFGRVAPHVRVESGEQRCPDCGIFARRTGPGGPCPHCDEPIAIKDLITVT